MQFPFRGFPEQLWDRRPAAPTLRGPAFSKILRMRLKETASGSKFLVLRIALSAAIALHGVHQIVRTRGECGVHFVVGEAFALRNKNRARSSDEIQNLLFHLR